MRFLRGLYITPKSDYFARLFSLFAKSTTRTPPARRTSSFQAIHSFTLYPNLFLDTSPLPSYHPPFPKRKDQPLFLRSLSHPNTTHPPFTFTGPDSRKPNSPNQKTISTHEQLSRKRSGLTYYLSSTSLPTTNSCRATCQAQARTLLSSHDE